MKNKMLVQSWDTVVWLVIAAVALTELASDMFSPGLPAIAKYFSATQVNTQFTVSFYIAGLGFSSLIYGSLSDHYGRRFVLLTGISLFTFGSLITLFPYDLHLLVLARLIQGMGAGSALTVGIPIINDLYTTNKAASVMSGLGIVVAISPGLSPVIGGYIAHYWGWYCILLILFAISCLLFIVCVFYLKETNQRKKSTPFKTVDFFLILKGYSYLLTNKNFLYFCYIQAACFSFVFSEAITLPFLYIQVFSIKPQFYGYFMAFTITIYVIGALINKKMVLRIGVKRMLKIGLLLQLLSFSILVLLSVKNYLNPYLIQILKIPGTIGTAFVFANCIPQALVYCKKEEGSATSLMCFIQMMMAVVVTYIVSFLYRESALSLYGISFVITLLSLLAYKYAYGLHNEVQSE